MRQFSAAFADHIASGETRLCFCWILRRTDGTVTGFTDHDETVQLDGVPCSPLSGFQGSEAAARLGLEIDTSEVLGILDSGTVTAQDIRLGRFNGARVETWRVKWDQPAVNARLRVDTIGEITEMDGAFRAELRSLHAELNRPTGRIYQRTCDAALGDTRCGMDLDNPDHWRDVTVTATGSRQRVQVSGLDGLDDSWAVAGTVAWATGTRAGLRDRVAGQSASGGLTWLTLDAEPLASLVPGDAGRVTVGCDKRFETCKAKFANALNFQGFPHLPGASFVLRYPQAGSVLDGRPLVR